MLISKVKLTAGLVALGCVAACAAPGVLAAISFGGLAGLGAALASTDIVWLPIAAVAGGSAVYLWTRRQARDALAKQSSRQCAVSTDGKSGCGCNPA